jgi:hypothetical protein
VCDREREREGRERVCVRERHRERENRERRGERESDRRESVRESESERERETERHGVERRERGEKESKREEATLALRATTPHTVGYACDQAEGGNREGGDRKRGQQTCCGQPGSRRALDLLSPQHLSTLKGTRGRRTRNL